MNCKSCNTRIPGNANNCPNCGLVSSPKFSVGNTDDGTSKLGPSNAHEEIDLDEIATPVAPRKGKAKAVKSRPAPPSESTSKVAATSRERANSSSGSSSGSGFSGTPRPAELRAMLAEQLALLERGLKVFAKGGKPIGEKFDTDLGEIDLLAADDAGGLVLIMIADADSKDIVTELLGRIGWVRKHVAKTGQEVRGIVLAEAMPESAQYMAAAVADTICFKKYQIALSFSDMEV